MNNLKLTVGALLLLFSSFASAAIITDTVSQNAYVGYWSSFNYQHNLMEPGDDPFALGSAESANLEVSISDDGGLFDGWETILVQVENFDFDTGGILFSASNFINDLEVNALASLNSDGILDVTIYSILGDFYVGDSILTVTTSDSAVPEPSILALFGAGLLGLGFARKQRKA
jgi:hypothetical protein